MTVSSGYDPTIGVTDPTTPSADGRKLERRLELPLGAHIDRYVIVKLLGRGGMGSVYAAHDPKLDRQIALKVLHSMHDPEAAERMVHEAQALARLDDPRVVQVYDAGDLEGAIYIAMQLVDGEDLAAALRRRSPGVPLIISWFVEAGRGLAAAHAAGLVHRDFKPNNVLIDRRGRVAVTDFGLARQIESPRGVTQVGTFLGTPAYMSPEQHGQLEATEASDQFSYCVSLWEALFGAHPFVVGDRGSMSPVAIGFAIYDGDLIPPRRGHRVPRRVIEALTRGLSRDPAKRWPSMNELIAELAPAQKRSVWPIVALAGGIAAVAGGGAVWLAVGGGDETATCSTDASSRVAAAWSDLQAQQIHDRFAKSGKSYADAAARQLRASLDKYSAHWREVAGDVCTAERAAKGAVPELVARRRACLDSRLDALRTLVGLLAGEDKPEFVEHAQAMSEGLPDLAECNDADALLAVPASPPAAKATEIANLDHDLSTAVARGNGGEYERSKKELAGIATRADALGWAPLAARAHIMYGERLMLMQDPLARDESTKGAELAMRNRMDRQAVRAWGAAMIAAGAARKPDVVAALEPVVRATAARTGDRLLELAADVAYGRALARVHQLKDAVAVCRAALDQAKALDNSSQASNARNCLVEALVPSGAWAEVGPIIDQQLAETTRELGPDHPRVSDYLSEKAMIEERQGKLQDARRDAQHVLDIRRQAYGDHDIKLAEAIDGLAGVAEAEGKSDEALKLYEQALAIASSLEQTDLALVGTLHQSIAYRLQASDDHKGAIEHFAAADKLLRERAGNDSMELAFLLLNYGQVKAEDDVAAGIAMLKEARGILEAKHDKRALAASGAMAVVAGMHKKWPEARTYAEDALSHVDADSEPHNVALLQWYLAESLAETKGDRKRAHELAQSARSTFAKLGPRYAGNVKQIDAWLAKH